jgi:hypothetical protein
MINEDFGLPISGRDKVALLRELNDFLLELHAQKKRPVLIIDEAQNLTPAGLEEIRLLSNLEANDAKLLQIVMVGQTELKQTIAKYELRQLRQRISVHCHLEPLNREETEEYILHRLELAGNRHAVNWGDGTFDVLYQSSQGVPRLINVFCDFVLLAAYVDGLRDIAPELVIEVVGDTSWEQHLEVGSLSSGEGHGALRQDMIKRLASSEQKMAQLQELSRFRHEFSQHSQIMEKLLRDILAQQEAGVLQVRADLERTTSLVQKIVSENAATSNKSGAIAAKSKSRKGFLGKHFM